MKTESLKDKILKVLRGHPEGLTTVEISGILGVHRHTLTKYVYQLLGEGVIFQRKVGTAKLCYLSGKNERKP